MQVLPEVSYFLRYFDTVICMNIGTARTNTPSSHPVRGHPATSALVSLSPFFRHRTAGLLRCFPFLHTAPGVPESQFPLRPRAGVLRPPSGTPVEDFCLVFGILPFASIGVVVGLCALPGYSLCYAYPMLQQPESVNLNRSETREWRGPRGSRKAEDEES